MLPSSPSSLRLKREQDWAELASLLDKLESRRGKLQSVEEAERLGELYRRTATHLSVIRTHPQEKRLEAKVQQLVVRAHGFVYRPGKSDIPHGFLKFFRSSFPATVRQHSSELLLAMILFFVGGLLGWGATHLDPDLYYAIVPLEEARSPAAAIDSLEESLTDGREADLGVKSIFSGFLWQHNVRVSLLVFALGALLGIPTALLLFYNGLMLGAMSAVFMQADLGTVWFAWLAGHGVTEILAILLAGAGGFALGRAALHPGTRTRATALREAGANAVNLALGTILMLFIAAILESFFRQSDASTSTRFLLAIGSGVFWAVYFMFSDRKHSLQTA